eukprot:CAMPEP_0197042326 /NCGR_PEP_ID=MMETSP1384-20130603/18708_1 /TAXON_ID=29189 /ORGANISM="Ammonia sp." /LENGTH=461 /DNA_ID=CAMNT_0042473407 /DNA_START=5 /DNA_END=1390 /DNA_ORIENTATION=+
MSTSVKVTKMRSGVNRLQTRSKSEPCGHVNREENEMVNIQGTHSKSQLALLPEQDAVRTEISDRLGLLSNAKMSMKNKDIEKDDIREYSPATWPVIHPENEDELKALPLFCSQWRTCHIFIYGYIRETMGTYYLRWRRIHHRSLEFITQIIENYAYKSLRITAGETKELYPKSEFLYNYVIIEDGGILTSRNQGIICIQCFDMIIHKNGTLHLNGKGYNGGLPEKQGGSYMGNHGVFTTSKQPNYGGGGGGILFGGGGGYGTKGESGDSRYVYKSGDGGLTYGDTRELDYDENFNHFYMGSGGGGGYNDGRKKIASLYAKEMKAKVVNGHSHHHGRDTVMDKTLKLSNISRGGDGGGGLFLNIMGNLHLHEGALIQCNGLDGYKGLDCGGGGGGSGGTILIHLNNTYNMIMEYDSHIQAIGGCGATPECGNGGYGRIRIKFRVGDDNIRLPKNIKPKPFIG